MIRPRKVSLYCIALLTASTAVGGVPDLLVSSRFTDQVLAFDATGQPAGVAAAGGGLDNPVGVTFGPDGDLYVASGDGNQVLRYDGDSGAFVAVFASGGGLNGTRQINFGPDGHLYVASGGSDQILRYHGTTGAFMGVFAQAAQLDGPTGFTFGPDRNLYATSVVNNRIVRFDGKTGAFMDVFISGSGLAGPHDVTFGPDGLCYVVNAFGGAQKVKRYDPVTGALIGTFVTDTALSFPLGLVFGPDGDLYLANQGGDDVRRYDGQTGALVGSHVAGGSGGLDGSMFLAFRPDPAGPTQHAPTPPGVGQEVLIHSTGVSPGGLIGVFAGVSSASLPFCNGQTFGIASPVIVAVGIADEGGQLVLRLFAGAPLAGQTVLFQTVDATGCGASGVTSHTF